MTSSFAARREIRNLRMRTALFAAVLLAFIGPTSAATLPDEQLVNYIEGRVAVGEYVGMVVGYFDDSGSYLQAFGHTSKTSGQPPNALTLFEISSVSKTFAATLLAHAAVLSELGLDDPVNRHLGERARLASFNGQAVRLRDLAAHRSGLPNRPAFANDDTEINAYATFSERHLVAAINAYEPGAAPGSDYGYSALGYGVLALALSTSLNAPFEELVHRRLTSPLGMSDTVFSPNAEQRSRLAVGYTPEGTVAAALDQGALRAAGSMYSTVTDLMIWVRLHAEKPDSPLGRAARVTQMAESESHEVALAWHRTPGQNDWSQYGTANGYRAFVGFLSDGSRGAVVLANTIANVQDIGQRLLLDTELPTPESR